MRPSFFLENKSEVCGRKRKGSPQKAFFFPRVSWRDTFFGWFLSSSHPSPSPFLSSNFPAWSTTNLCSFKSEFRGSLREIDCEILCLDRHHLIFNVVSFFLSPYYQWQQWNSTPTRPHHGERCARRTSVRPLWSVVSAWVALYPRICSNDTGYVVNWTSIKSFQKHFC